MHRICRNELRNLANRVLTFYKTQKRIRNDIFTVDIEALAEMLGYRVQNVFLGDDAELMGFTAFEPSLMILEDQNGYAIPVSADTNTIIMNQSIKETCPGRYNFTLAHEVAHLILDMVYHLGYRVKYRSKPKLIKNELYYTPFDYEEYLADRLASLLLLPDSAIRKEFKRSFGKIRIDIISPFGNREHYYEFCKMAEFFGVSREALGIRLEQIGMLGKYKRYQYPSALDIIPDAQVC